MAVESLGAHIAKAKEVAGGYPIRVASWGCWSEQRAGFQDDRHGASATSMQQRKGGRKKGLRKAASKGCRRA